MAMLVYKDAIYVNTHKMVWTDVKGEWILQKYYYFLYKVFIHLMGQGFCSYFISFYNNYKLVIFNNILKLYKVLG